MTHFHNTNTLTGLLFSFNLISATVQTLLWSVIFFFSSPAASAAYLTVSEIFPLEVRALAISFFYSMGKNETTTLSNTHHNNKKKGSYNGVNIFTYGAWKVTLSLLVVSTAGTGLGGVVAPLLFGYLLETEQAINIFYGYLVAASLMLAAATVEVLIGTTVISCSPFCHMNAWGVVLHTTMHNWLFITRERSECRTEIFGTDRTTLVFSRRCTSCCCRWLLLSNNNNHREQHISTSMGWH